MVINQYKMILDEGKPCLVKESSKNMPGIWRLNSPAKIYDLFRMLGITRYAEEYIYLLAVDTKCKLIGLFEVSHGTVNSSLITPREVLIRALLCGAVGIFLVHNHPSDGSEPSKEDCLITERMKQACELVGIKLFDHIIIGNGYYSFRENENVITEQMTIIGRLHQPTVSGRGFDSWHCQGRCNVSFLTRKIQVPFANGSPGNPFFLRRQLLQFYFLLPVARSLLSTGFADVHHKLFPLKCKGRSLILLRFAQSDYHLNPCI